ncbi:MAG: PxKF domain-containing protein [Steroidobacteraceae bacterium]
MKNSNVLRLTLPVTMLLVGSMPVAAAASAETLAFNTPSDLLTCQNPGNPVNLGLRFTVNEALTIDGLGWYFDPACSENYSGDQAVAIYADNGTLITSVTVPAPALPSLPAQGYVVQEITPLTLVQGATYRVVTQTGNNAWGYGGPGGTDSRITFREQYYKYGATLMFTTDTAGSAGVYGGPNMRIASPVASTTTEITDVAPSPVTSGSSYTVAGTVTVSSQVPASPGVSVSGDLPGKVLVTGDGSCEDATLAPGASTGQYDFSCDLTAGPEGDKSLNAAYSGDTGYSESEGTASQRVTTPVSAISCDGFFAPVDRAPMVNKANAGRAIPLKWRCTQNGIPVTSVPETWSVTTQLCTSVTATSTLTDVIEEYVGTSGLINQGDGYWQFNWAVPKGYANSCRTLTVTFGDALLSADFRFVR